MTTVLLASDHAGLDLKQTLIQHLQQAGITTEDLGPNKPESVDYPDYAAKVGQAVRNRENTLGILICGTGIGMSIAANKIRGVRAALCHTEFEAQMCRAHNNANVLCLGARVINPDTAISLADAYLQTPFEGGRHERRVAKISALAQQEARV